MSSISRRYGRALFELASESSSAEEVGTGLAALAEAIRGLDAGALAPGILTAAQRDQLAKKLAESIGRDSLLGRFVAVLASNDRLEQLPAISERYDRLQDSAAGRVRIHVRSAAALGDAERAALRQKFEKITGRKVLDTVGVDDALLGGVTVEAEGRVYDGSVRTLLARLERRMAG